MKIIFAIATVTVGVAIARQSQHIRVFNNALAGAQDAAAVGAPNGTDHCFSAQNCTACIARAFCGWCSSPVTGGNGAQCAGFDKNNPSNKPFICHGTYQTTQCLPPPPPPKPPMPMPPPPPPPPPKPHPPPQVTGTWRGLAIQDGYKHGEWNFTFASTSVTVHGPNSQMWVANVTSNPTNMDFKYTTGPFAGKVGKGIYEIGFGPVEKFLTYGQGMPGGARPKSWQDAMQGNGSMVWMLYHNKQI